METYTLSQFPSTVNTIRLALFRNVRNAPEIRKRLIEASVMEGPEGDIARAELDYGFVEASLIVSRAHLLTAIQTTLINSLIDPPPGSSNTTPTIKTRSHNLHSELLLSLSPNNNITDSIRRHGLSDTTKDLIVVKIGGSDSPQPQNESHDHDQAENKGRESEIKVYEDIIKVVEGELRSFDELDEGKLIDWPRVDKAYKLGEMQNLKLPDLLSRKKAAVINSVATKSVM